MQHGAGRGPPPLPPPPPLLLLLPRVLACLPPPHWRGAQALVEGPLLIVVNFEWLFSLCVVCVCGCLSLHSMQVHDIMQAFVLLEQEQRQQEQQAAADRAAVAERAAAAAQARNRWPTVVTVAAPQRQQAQPPRQPEPQLQPDWVREEERRR